MSKICAIAKVVVLPGKRAEMLSAFSELMRASRNEPGTPVYAIHSDNDNENLIWFYEVFEDERALKVHSEAAADLVERVVGQYAAEPPEIHMLTPEMHTGY